MSDGQKVQNLKLITIETNCVVEKLCVNTNKMEIDGLLNYYTCIRLVYCLTWIVPHATNLQNAYSI